MAPLSILPGRFRFESDDLLNSPSACRHLQHRLATVRGVRSVSANPRTGRVLIDYEARLLTQGDLERIVPEKLTDLPCREVAMERSFVTEPPVTGDKEGKPVAAGIGRQLLMDVVAHAVLPAPLNLLLPTAVFMARR